MPCDRFRYLMFDSTRLIRVIIRTHRLENEFNTIKGLAKTLCCINDTWLNFAMEAGVGTEQLGSER
ncbi:hypothetical protein OK016_25010 [Vibrio chagasii]|nr:hypothetical protein [Vibrio chagasii]